MELRSMQVQEGALMMAVLAMVAAGCVRTYGHPTAEALCRVQQAGAKVYATHRVGTVTVETDGVVAVARGTAESVDYCLPGSSYWAG